jgi:hypothetical protein
MAMECSGSRACGERSEIEWIYGCDGCEEVEAVATVTGVRRRARGRRSGGYSEKATDARKLKRCANAGSGIAAVRDSIYSMRGDPSIPKGFWEMVLFGPSHLLHRLGRLLRPTIFRLGLSCFSGSNPGSPRANLLFAIYKRVHR